MSFSNQHDPALCDLSAHAHKVSVLRTGWAIRPVAQQVSRNTSQIGWVCDERGTRLYHHKFTFSAHTFFTSFSTNSHETLHLHRSKVRSYHHVLYVYLRFYTRGEEGFPQSRMIVYCLVTIFIAYSHCLICETILNKSQRSWVKIVEQFGLTRKRFMIMLTMPTYRQLIPTHMAGIGRGSRDADVSSCLVCIWLNCKIRLPCLLNNVIVTQPENGGDWLQNLIYARLTMLWKLWL